MSESELRTGGVPGHRAAVRGGDAGRRHAIEQARSSAAAAAARPPFPVRGMPQADHDLAGIATEPDWVHEPTKVAVYLDGMSRGLHGDPNVARKDQIIRQAVNWMATR